MLEVTGGGGTGFGVAVTRQTLNVPFAPPAPSAGLVTPIAAATSPIAATPASRRRKCGDMFPSLEAVSAAVLFQLNATRKELRARVTAE
jgi:hypothetical protein